MKGAMNKILGAAAMAAFVAACSSSDDKDVAGGASGDMGIVASAITGDAQKGPFVKGSAVTVQGIDCKTLQLTDERFEGEVNSDKGDFSVKDVSLKSTCALFEVTGLYRSEITGKTSSKELTLRALTDLKDRESVNINILTNLEYERLVHLVTEKGKTFAEAKAQAEQEVLAAFDIAGSFEEFENLNIFESGDGNAALLAVSVMMQAKTDDAGLAKRIEKFEDSFAETGMWKDSAAKATISDWAAGAIAGNGLDSIRKNIEAWDIGDTVAAFEKYITAEFPDTLILSSASREGSSSSSKDVVLSGDSHEGSSSSFANANDGSEYDATANTLKDLRDGKVYKTVKIGSQVWMAENLDYETEKSYCYNDSSKYCDKYGRLYTWATAVGKSEEECGLGKECNLPSGNVRGVCPDGWYLPSEADFATLIKVMGGEKDAGTKLKSTSGWNDDDGESGNGTDSFGFSALAAGIGNAGVYGGVGYTTSFWGSTECGSEFASETGDGCAYAMYLDYDDVNVNLMSYAAKDLVHSVRCVKGDSSTAPVRPSSSSSVTSVSSSSAEVQPNSSETESSSSSGDDKMNCSALLEGETDWNWNVPKECRFNPDIDYGTMTDERDGKVYRTVKIGNQVWMAENLNYYDSTNLNIKEASWCYGKSDNKDSSTCDVTGRLYTWAAAITVCPSDWRLPSDADWDSLFSVVGGRSGGRNLKSLTGWYGDGGGTDSFGFSAIPGGHKYDGGAFFSVGIYAYFWSSTEREDGKVRGMSLYYSYDDMTPYIIDKNVAYSVRCVRD